MEEEEVGSTWAPQTRKFEVLRAPGAGYGPSVDIDPGSVEIKPPLAQRGGCHLAGTKSRVQMYLDELRTEGKTAFEPLRDLDVHSSAPFGAAMNFETDAELVPSAHYLRKRRRSRTCASTVYRVQYPAHATDAAKLRASRDAQRARASEMRGDHKPFQSVVGSELYQYCKDCTPATFHQTCYSADKLRRLRQLTAVAAGVKPDAEAAEQPVPPAEVSEPALARGSTPRSRPAEVRIPAPPPPPPSPARRPRPALPAPPAPPRRQPKTARPQPRRAAPRLPDGPQTPRRYPHHPSPRLHVASYRAHAVSESMVGMHLTPWLSRGSGTRVTLQRRTCKPCDILPQDTKPIR
eukprot:TRINITY_DN10198_c0_g2_i2.p1 TRINITY_DN10198_c0_g2~~TRINITY_DN10198_c0_g2_i2.p1  ORF type:complete len:349 (+),score=94.70 TRINITY_DN10198_c0_g2_i2:59-1105(+)